MCRYLMIRGAAGTDHPEMMKACGWNDVHYANVQRTATGTSVEEAMANMKEPPSSKHADVSDPLHCVIMRAPFLRDDEGKKCKSYSKQKVLTHVQNDSPCNRSLS